MIGCILRTSWTHMTRMRNASLGIMGILTVLFLTLFIGISMVGFLQRQRDLVAQKFTYPLFLQKQYTVESSRVKTFLEGLKNDKIISMEPTSISKEIALDAQIQHDPTILTILSGDNPLPDTLMVPLYGTDIERLWVRVLEYRDIFEQTSSIDSVRQHLRTFESSLNTIERTVQVVIFFLILTAVVMALLIFSILRYHIRLFHDELIIGRLVGAEPYFFWGPHAVSIMTYTGVALMFSGIFFLLLRWFF
jgi:cell division protein FtsX